MVVYRTLKDRERDDLDHRHVERVGGVDGAVPALDVVGPSHLRDDDRVRSNWAGVLAVDPEVGLERERHLDAWGHVHERAPDQTARGEAENLLSSAGTNVRITS